MSKKFALAISLALCAAPLMAQNAPPASYPGGMRRGGVAPCLQKAGVDRSAMQQMMSIQREMRSQVESVCSNSSLSAQQKQEQVQQIREQSRQKIDSLITPEQQKTLQACRQEQGGGHAGGGMMNGVVGGCGEGQRGGARPGGGTAQSGNPPASN